MQIRWGMVGTGYIANAFAKAIEAVEDASLAAVASRTKEKAEQFAREYQIEKAYGSYEELMKDPQIDAVYIATPHSEHLKNAMEAIANGKHVLCEKPMTLNREDTSRLKEAAKDAGVFLMEAMWTKFLPVTEIVKGWIQEKRIGAIDYMDVKFGFVAEYDPKSRLYNKELGGGALLDVGIYPVTYAVEMLSKCPDEITAFAKFAKTGADMVNTIQFTYEQGPVVSLHSSICGEIGTDAVITGEKGKVIVPDFYAASGAKLFNDKGELVEEVKMPFAVNGYEYEIMEATECIRQGKIESAKNPMKDTETIMGLLDAVRQQWDMVYPGGK